MQIVKPIANEEKWISKYFEIVKPKYSILQIIPHTSNRNYDTELIAQTIGSLYKRSWERIELNKTGRYTFKLSYYQQEKSSFIVDISKKDCKFYLMVPDRLKGLFTEKCKEIWKRVEVNEVYELPSFEGEKYQVNYNKDDALSLKVNKKSNEPLNNIMSVMDQLEEDEAVKILYNFIPINQGRWRGIYKETMSKIKKGLPVEKNKLSFEYLLITFVNVFIYIIDFTFSLIDTLFTGKENAKKTKEGNDKLSKLSKSTVKKEDETIIGTQIVITTVGKFRRTHSSAIAVSDSFKSISEDNSLNHSKLNNKEALDLEMLKIKGAKVNKMSTSECNNFIQIPGRELLDKHNIETMGEVLETPPPKELQEGNITLGECTGKNKEIKAFHPTEYNKANLALLLLSPQGGGKTTYLENFSSNANRAGQGVIVLDYIKNCDLAEAVKGVVDKRNVIDLDLSKPENFQALAYNEISYSGKDEFMKFKVANMKAEQTMAFIDAANIEGDPLSSRMRRYLSAAANIVYLNNSTSIGDVINSLSDFRYRLEVIEYAKKHFKDEGSYLLDFINTLEELNEVETDIDKKTKEVLRKEIVGTKDSKIDGIMDRVNLIKENIYIRYMLYKKPDKNINFIEAMEQGKVVLIKMPEDTFYSKVVKNVLVTFFTSKIILATKLRGAMSKEPKTCNVIYDELYQAPTAQGELSQVLSQLRKFGTKIVISAHYMDQLSNRMKHELKASGASYMLIEGADKKNFEELKEELSPYELEDLLKLKPFHSLNLIRYSKGYAKFITKLPPPLKFKKKGEERKSAA